MNRSNSSAQDFLPDFASLSNALRIIFLALIIAVIITIGRNSVFDERTWQDLNLLTAFALMISFVSVIVLKLAHRSRPAVRAGGRAQASRRQL